MARQVVVVMVALGFLAQSQDSPIFMAEVVVAVHGVVLLVLEGLELVVTVA
jgi:hypothetical protein